MLIRPHIIKSNNYSSLEFVRLLNIKVGER